MGNSDAALVLLGTTGLRVRPLGIGTNRWGPGRGSGRAARPELKPVFDEALSFGLTFFDTAEVYGMGGSERTLGYCLKAAGGDRALAPVIATKFFPMPWRLRKRAMAAALRRSLTRLGLSKVDLYLVHFPMPPVSIETWADALADTVDAGLTRAVGVSNHNPAEMRRAHAALAARGVPLACNEVEYSLLKRDVERNGLLAACRELGVTLIAYRPLALGLLPGKHTSANPPSGWRGMAFRRLYPPGIESLAALLTRIGEQHGGKTLTQVALNWVICKGALPIPGATRVDHVRENAGALGWRLTDEEIAALDAAEERLRASIRDKENPDA